MIIGYTFDEHWYKKLREVEKNLHGINGAPLTSDRRRDLANLLSLILAEMQPVTKGT